MALAANSIISQNRNLNSLGFRLLKLRRSILQHRQKLNLQFQEHCCLGIAPISCVAKTTFSDVQVQTTSTSSTNSWAEFAKNVSGEWDGFGADFTSEGTPIELPEHVVPEAYREWEVKVFDWQTQCPTLGQPEETTMFYKSIKLLPTVGCEADAATDYQIDERTIDKVHAFAYQSSGCYVAVWPIEDSKLLELEHCLINPQDRESRVRIIQVVHVQDNKMTLKNIRVFREQWYGPFRNGDQLGGCAIRDSSFAATDALKASELVGSWQWQAPCAVAHFAGSQDNSLQELVGGDRVRKFTRDESELVLLPKQLWCSLKESGTSETFAEAGWLFDQASAITSRCIFSTDAKLKEISIAQETASSENL